MPTLKIKEHLLRQCQCTRTRTEVVAATEQVPKFDLLTLTVKLNKVGK